MKHCLTAACVAAVALAAPAAASAATLAVDPVKDCYRSGETVNLLATGFTANVSGGIRVTRGTTLLGDLSADALGNAASPLKLGQPDGIRTSTYTATDTTNRALTASLALQVSAVKVGVRPENGRPGRRVRIKATGFTTGKALWVHIRKGGYKRDLRVGRLKGACGRLTGRERFLPRNASAGVYTVQFDTFRRYRKNRVVRKLFTLTVRPVSAAAASSVAPATTWDRLF